MSLQTVYYFKNLLKCVYCCNFQNFRVNVLKGKNLPKISTHSHHLQSCRGTKVMLKVFDLFFIKYLYSIVPRDLETHCI